MPLEISEIGVHVAVGPSVGPQGAQEPQPPAGGQTVALTPEQHQSIVDACVKQVMENLRQMQER